MLRATIIWLALCGSLAAQTFVGPSSAAIGESVAVRVTGVTLPAVPAEAARAVLVGVDSPDESLPASLFGGVFWDFATGQPQLLLFFRAETSGVYVLSAVAPKEATPKIVSKRIQVGEVVPSTTNPIPPGPGPTTPNTTTPTPPAVPRKATKATYVYEKSKHQVPGAVSAALRELSLGPGVFGSAIDQDIKNGDGKTPAQYERPIAMAQIKGLPCLVVEFSDGTIDAVPNVTTADDVRKAVAK
jgi:hypothetical protein